MSTATHPPETDLALPEGGADTDPHTIHTHYFGANVPEAQLGAFLYIRYQPAFGLSQGGVCIFRGFDNLSPLDMEFVDYQMTMPWPTVEGNSFTTANGLRIEFTEPGRSARVTYRSADGRTTVDVEQTAVSPLLARGHVMPGEETASDPTRSPGGSEQFMRVSGEIVVGGERHEVDCFAPRDRSWNQVRAEAPNAPMPPVGWSPMCFGEDRIFNQISFEALDTEPRWAGLFDVPADKPTHHFAWLYEDGELREITRVRRDVLEYHPQFHAALRQEIEAEDAEGGIHRFRGEAVAMATIPAWPNVSFRDSVYRWEDDSGRVAHATYQEIWHGAYQRAMKDRAAAAVSA